MTREIELTKGQVTLVDDADYEELNQHNWYAYECNVGFYAARFLKRDMIFMHRVIMGAPDDMEIDHIDHDTLNNQKSNLRLCTPSQNQANALKRDGCSSQYKGVSWHRRDRRWQSYIKKKGKSIYLGYYEDEQEAAKAYNEAAKELFGEFARLNVVGE